MMRTINVENLTRQLLGKHLLMVALCVAAASTTTSAQTPAPAPTPTPARPIIGSPTAAAGFQQLAKDRLASDFIQDRVYRFKEAGDLWLPYSIFVPRNYDKSKKWPLIVNLHGLNITPVQQIRFEGVAELAEKYGYIVVCPMGYSVRSFWGMPNIGRGLIAGEPGFENEKSLKLECARACLRGHDERVQPSQERVQY
jgi:poly(3-hydroxybutyrate) depolymerase